MGNCRQLIAENVNLSQAYLEIFNTRFLDGILIEENFGGNE